MNKIGLLHVDGKLPNLALMKISTFYKRQGYKTEFVNFFEKYEKVFISKIFTFSKEPETVINANEIVKGGTGYDLVTKLPAEIEACYPDYSLYNYPKAMGFLTRGCPRNCKFCIVGQKEGLQSAKVANLNQFWKAQKEIEILDPNILAYPNHEELLQQVIASKASIYFTQGLDCRLITKQNIKLLNKIKLKRVSFAYDQMQISSSIEAGLLLAKEHLKTNSSNVNVFILTNFNTSFEEDLFRIEFVRKLGFKPYVMVFDKHKLQQGSKYLKLQRWCNTRCIIAVQPDFNKYIA